MYEDYDTDAGKCQQGLSGLRPGLRSSRIFFSLD